MTDESVIMREGDTVTYVISFPMLLHTFMAVFSQHDPMICQVTDELAYHVTPLSLTNEGLDEEEINVILQLKSIMRRTHETESTEEEGRLHQGKDGMFDGMYYGEMFPWELGMLGLEVAQSISKYKTTRAPVVEKSIKALSPWVEAADRLVRPEEVMGILMGLAPPLLGKPETKKVM